MHDSSPTSSASSPIPSVTPPDSFPFISFIDFLDDLSLDWPQPPQTPGSPIAILPPELLSVIFNYLIEDDPLCVPIMLSHVSWLWRRIATSTPSLWRSLVIKLPPRSADVTISRTETWLSRAGLYPVDITLNVGEIAAPFSMAGMGVERLLKCLKQHACHWGSFVLKTGSHDLCRILFLYFMRGKDTWIPSPHSRHPKPFSMLMRVDLDIGVPGPTFHGDDASIQFQEADIQVQYDVNDIFKLIAAVSPARLRHLNLAVSAIPTNFTSNIPPNFNLTTLQIFERTNMINSPFIAPAAFLNLVSLCPRLEVLTFRGAVLSSDPLSLPPNTEECIELPSLHTLCIGQTSYQRMILSYLAAPKLQTLKLVWLNQEATGPVSEPPFFTPIAIAANPSVVSSEGEELTEFSQSPWTDILTGTGLRAFIYNSGSWLPHLKVIDMDFADMRSPKDFRWVFSRTPNLEVFRMVGSDMSDKVLNALSRPRRTADGNMEWLCSRLRQVELNRCDVITGEGVMNLARTRGRNSPCGDESVARLERCDVEGCSRVDCTSVAVVKYLVEQDVCFDVDVQRGSSIFSDRGITMPGLS